MVLFVKNECSLSHLCRPCVELLLQVLSRTCVWLQSGTLYLEWQLYGLTWVAVFETVGERKCVERGVYLTAINLDAVALDVEPSHTLVQEFQTAQQEYALDDVLLVAALGQRYPFRIEVLAWQWFLRAIVVVFLCPAAYRLHGECVLYLLLGIDVVPVLVIGVSVVLHLVGNEVLCPDAHVGQRLVVLAKEGIGLRTVEECLLCLQGNDNGTVVAGIVVCAILFEIDRLLGQKRFLAWL